MIGCSSLTVVEHGQALAKTLFDIPKFKTVWDKTKYVHNFDFIQFMDSL